MNIIPFSSPGKRNLPCYSFPKAWIDCLWWIQQVLKRLRASDRFPAKLYYWIRAGRARKHDLKFPFAATPFPCCAINSSFTSILAPSAPSHVQKPPGWQESLPQQISHPTAAFQSCHSPTTTTDPSSSRKGRNPLPFSLRSGSHVSVRQLHELLPGKNIAKTQCFDSTLPEANFPWRTTQAVQKDCPSGTKKLLSLQDHLAFSQIAFHHPALVALHCQN